MLRHDRRAQVSAPINHVFIPAFCWVLLSIPYIFAIDFLSPNFGGQLTAGFAFALAVGTYVVLMYGVHKLGCGDTEKNHG